VQRFLDWPDWLFGILVVAIALLIGVGGVLLTRKWVARLHAIAPHNEVVSYYLSTVAVFYGIMLGLIAVGVWEDFNSARTAVGLEAGAVAAVYRDVSGYPEPQRSALQADLREYVRYEIDVAWALRRKGIIANGGMDRMWRFQDKLQAFEPKTEGQEALHSQTLRAYDDLVEKRNLRLASISSHLPRPLWRFVVVGAMLSFGVSWFFQPKNPTMHLWMTAIFAALIGLEIHILFIMDNPYRGSIGVSPQAFQDVYDMLMR
jgi:hypothetical protein